MSVGGKAELEGFANASLILCEGSEGGGPCKHVREAEHAAQLMGGRGVMLVQASLLEWVKRIGVCRACAGSAEKLLKVLASGFTWLLPLKSCIDPRSTQECLILGSMMRTIAKRWSKLSLQKGNAALLMPLQGRMGSQLLHRATGNWRSAWSTNLPAGGALMRDLGCTPPGGCSQNWQPCKGAGLSDYCPLL